MKEPKWLSDLDMRCSLETKQLLAHIRELREVLDRCSGLCETGSQCEAQELLARKEPPETDRADHLSAEGGQR